MCKMPGCARPPPRASARSRTALASSVPAPAAGSPVARFHSAHGVRFISASANSVATSRSSGWDRYTSRIASAYPALHAEQSSAGSADGYLAASAPTSARSTAVAPAARLAAAADAAKARETTEDLSARSNASHGLL